MLKAFVISFVTLVALVPAVFWASYGTTDVCTAFQRRMAEKVSQKEGQFAGAVGGLMVSGAVGIGKLSTRKCFSGLWTLETKGVDAAMHEVGFD